MMTATTTMNIQLREYIIGKDCEQLGNISKYLLTVIPSYLNMLGKRRSSKRNITRVELLELLSKLGNTKYVIKKIMASDLSSVFEYYKDGYYRLKSKNDFYNLDKTYIVRDFFIGFGVDKFNLRKFKYEFLYFLASKPQACDKNKNKDYVPFISQGYLSKRCEGASQSSISYNLRKLDKILVTEVLFVSENRNDLITKKYQIQSMYPGRYFVIGKGKTFKLVKQVGTKVLVNDDGSNHFTTIRNGVRHDLSRFYRVNKSIQGQLNNLKVLKRQKHESGLVVLNELGYDVKRDESFVDYVYIYNWFKGNENKNRVRTVSHTDKQKEFVPYFNKSQTLAIIDKFKYVETDPRFIGTNNWCKDYLTSLSMPMPRAITEREIMRKAIRHYLSVTMPWKYPPL